MYVFGESHCDYSLDPQVLFFMEPAAVLHLCLINSYHYRQQFLSIV